MNADKLDQLATRGGSYGFTTHGQHYALRVSPIFTIVDQTLRLLGPSGKWSLQLRRRLDDGSFSYNEKCFQEQGLTSDELRERIRYAITHVDELLMEEVL